MRTLEELEQAFRDMGLTKLTWGRKQPPGAVADLMLQIHAFSQGLPWGKGWAAASEDEFEKSLAYVAVRARDYIAQVLENGPHEKPRVMRGDVRLVYGQSLSALPPKEDNP